MRKSRPSLRKISICGIMVLHQALDQAVKEQIIPSNQTNGCRIPQLEKKEMKVVAPEQVGSYLNATKENGVLPMFYLELTSGLHCGGLLALLRIWTSRNGQSL